MGKDPHDSTTASGEVVRSYDPEADCVVTPQKKSSFWGSVGSFLWAAADYLPYVGSIKQIGLGIAHGSWKEAGMGVLMLGVDAV